jgi:hypothetical protein
VREKQEEKPHMTRDIDLANPIWSQDLLGNATNQPWPGPPAGANTHIRGDLCARQAFWI